jgi:chromosome segregation ATPase
MSNNRNAKDGTFVVDGNRIDRESQKILIRLNESQWTYATSLRDVAELSQNGQVFYRMEEYLIPAGLVEEKAREDDATAYRGRRKFRLTRTGSSWLDEHEEAVAVPKSRAETQQMAYEAKEAAESAKDSVQEYRKKVNRIKNTAEDVEDDVNEWMATKNNHWKDLERRSSHTKSRSKDNEASVKSLKGRVSSIESDCKQKMKPRLTDNEKSIEELQAENAQLRRALGELQRQVDEIIEEMEKGRLDRLREKIADD